jgi:prepilin-type N-terminal cleavage/methylation domain-containing protein
MHVLNRAYLKAGRSRERRRPRLGGRSFAARRSGVSLMEVMVALTVMGVLLSLAAPSFHRSVEQSRADIAGANLRAIWAAERVYWLEYRTYVDDLSALTAEGLLDPMILAATDPYVYEVQSADSDSFTVRATRTGSERWAGYVEIDEEGAVSGEIAASGQSSITPGFL